VKGRKNFDAQQGCAFSKNMLEKNVLLQIENIGLQIK